MILWPLRFGWLLVLGLYKEDDFQIFKYVFVWLHSFCGTWEGLDDPLNRFINTRWLAVDTPTDRPKSFRNCCEVKDFGGVFVLSLCVLKFSVGLRAFVIGLIQISSQYFGGMTSRFETQKYKVAFLEIFRLMWESFCGLVGKLLVYRERVPGSNPGLATSILEIGISCFQVTIRRVKATKKSLNPTELMWRRRLCIRCFLIWCLSCHPTAVFCLSYISFYLPICIAEIF